MKLLYIGHYKENSGWSKAAINLIEAISTTDIDIVCRNVKLTNNEAIVPDSILKLEQKDLNNIDYCIQHVLPHHITGTNKFKKNIAHFVHEFDSIKYHQWNHNLKLVDEVWIPNNDSKIRLISDGFDENSLKIVPYAFDMSQYEDDRTRISFRDKNHTFKFYFICDIDNRKNIESIIRCFHSEFHTNEPVSLVLKVKKSGMHSSDLRKFIMKLCDDVKSKLRIHKDINNYNHELILTEDFTNEQMKTLHLSCDCYIGTTHGEGWGIPSFDAMCYGKTPICCNEGGPKDYIDRDDKNTGFLADGLMNICVHNNPAFRDIFTGLHHWFIPDEIQIKKAMRYYYENRDKIDRGAGLRRGEKFSYANIGSTIRSLLND